MTNYLLLQHVFIVFEGARSTRARRVVATGQDSYTHNTTATTTFSTGAVGKYNEIVSEIRLVGLFGGYI